MLQDSPLFSMRITRGHLILALMLAMAAAFWALKNKFVPPITPVSPISTEGIPRSLPEPPLVPPPASPVAPVAKKPVVPVGPRVVPPAQKKIQKPSSKKRTGVTSKLKPPLKKKAGQRFHVVQRGECLWVISRRYYGKGKMWTAIYKANHARIKNPRKIYTGQRFQIPSV